ncbi:MAG: 4-hydroxy-tetrahydrodipicolinate reductase [Christensenellales bacterium]|jgi:4-hydroxy-tetrahydrodipicolinate reductase
MTRIIISGACGRMGRMLHQAALGMDGIEIVAGVDRVKAEDIKAFPLYESLDQVKEKADAVVDFTSPQALDGIAAYCGKAGCGAVLATTAYSADDDEKVKKLAEKVPVFRSANMSVGINLLIDLVKKAAASLEGFDIEIIEKHHNQKIDSPSGTALMLADAANEVYGGALEYQHGRHTKTDKRRTVELGIHAVRGGTITGDHSVLFIGQDEVVELHHSAQSRMVFAQGALRAATFISGKEPGLYNMGDIIDSK